MVAIKYNVQVGRCHKERYRVGKASTNVCLHYDKCMLESRVFGIVNPGMT